MRLLGASAAIRIAVAKLCARVKSDRLLAISNTSPLIYLHQVSELDLLCQLYGRVRLPPAVATELKAGLASRCRHRMPSIGLR